ncbi:hypothetical protein GQ54DRAFT_300455 [Martensiomyces pterosporus]|nr:hypothetical protein GQ54DRAFT_300455 [Martensiomyces pterosporus]
MDSSSSLQPGLSETDRVKLLESQYKIKVDPAGSGDVAIIIVCAVVYGITSLLVIYAWANRDYLPIRAKRLTLTTLMLIAGILWYIGDIPNNGHVSLVGAWTNCKLWYVWFRVLFCYVFSAALLVRFYALDRVFNQHKPFRGPVVYIISTVIVVFHLALCLAAQLTDSAYTIMFDAVTRTYKLANACAYASIAIQGILWLAVVALMIRLRNIQSSFNELRESLIIFFIALALLLETLIVNVLYPKYPLMMSHRIAITLVDALASSSMVWVIIAHPVYKCIFQREEYEIEWMRKLNRDQLRNEYDVATSYQRSDMDLNSNNNAFIRHSFYGQDTPGQPGNTKTGLFMSAEHEYPSTSRSMLALEYPENTVAPDGRKIL